MLLLATLQYFMTIFWIPWFWFCDESSYVSKKYCNRFFLPMWSRIYFLLVEFLLRALAKVFFYPFFPRKQSKLFCFDLQRHYCVHFAAQKIVFGQVPLKVNQITCFFYQYHLSWQETSKTFFFNVLWKRTRLIMVFCLQNCYDLLWEKIVVLIKKNVFEITRTIYLN